jgi:hypothetical protein
MYSLRHEKDVGLSVISNVYRKPPGISILLDFGPSTLKSKSRSSPRPSFPAVLAAPGCRSSAPSADPPPSVDPMLPADPIPFAPSRRVRALCHLDSPGRWGAEELRPDSPAPCRLLLSSTPARGSKATPPLPQQQLAPVHLLDGWMSSSRHSRAEAATSPSAAEPAPEAPAAEANLNVHKKSQEK